MTDNLHATDPNLLALCAILRWFDLDLLLSLTEYTKNELTLLLTSPLVVPASEPQDTYRLHEDARTKALAQLRAERPHDRLRLHTQAFEHFLKQMEQTEIGARRAVYETCCLAHMDEVRLLLTERRDWHAIAKYVATVRATHPQQPRSLQYLAFYEGHVAIRFQDYDRGEAMLNALLAAPAIEDDLRMRVLNALGQSQWYQTHYDRSLALYQGVYALACKNGDLVYQGYALLNMGMVYHEIGFYEQAMDLNTQSLQIFRDLHDIDSEALALSTAGNSALQLGRWEIAQNYLQEAIRLHEAIGMIAGLANLYCLQGFLQHMQGDEPQSEALYLRSLMLSRSPEHSDPSAAMDSEGYLGFLYQTQARWSQALECYDHGIELARQLRNKHRLALLHYRRGEVLKQLGQPEQALLDDRQAIEIVESLRGAIKQEDIKIGLLGITELGMTQQMYETMVLLCLERDQPAEAFAYVERACSRAFLDLLAERAPELYSSLDQPIVSLSEVQSALSAQTLLLEYFTIGVLPRGENLISKLPPKSRHLQQHLALAPQILLFAITHDRTEVHRIALDPNSLRPPANDPDPGRRLLRERLLIHLREQLIEPVRHLLQERDLLYLIPHGPLHYVPFMALCSGTGNYLLQREGPAIAFAPSATILLRNCLRRASSLATGLLALGCNDSDAEPLRYAEAEARHIARLMGGEAWIGTAPKSEQLAGLVQQVRTLHIAGHAIYDPHDPLNSALGLGKGDFLSARAIMKGWDLGAELVTLSACTSGVSHVVPGDELIGLQRAFLFAGAATVVCTLWEAADLVALLIMDRFYSALHQGHPPALALRDAQVAVRQMSGRDLMATLRRWQSEDPELMSALGELPAISAAELDSALYADPIYWAPFMLIGRP